MDTQRCTVYTDACTRFRAVIEAGTGKLITSTISRASVGVVINFENGEKHIIARPVGTLETTYAEFLALYFACKDLLAKGVTKVDFYTDCINLALAINQGTISGIEAMRKLTYTILGLLDRFEDFTITWVPRRDNKEANDVARKAINKKRPAI
ncbi:14.7 kDa ribonuclease H-like protein [compost metagenome]